MATSYNTANRPDFVRSQYAFSAYIRDPENNPRPDDIEERRLKIYRELLYANVEGFLASTYPVLRKILPNEHWHAIIKDYFSNHLSQTPLFSEMPREFLKYLEQERTPHPDDPIFILELAHYEWIELALSILDKKINLATINPKGSLLDGIPVISPLAWLFSYRFPVHKISPKFLPKEESQHLTNLLVFRDHDDEVRFIEVNPVTTRLVRLIIDNRNKTSRELLEQIIDELDHPRPDVVIHGGQDILAELKQRNVILGVLA
ncbi:MAG: putative DNA-binding domain-containing protein [Nitrosomonas sp.]|nr:putative DNA-binding domain-containing protein [Nitrosomonas sp.]